MKTRLNEINCKGVLWYIKIIDWNTKYRCYNVLLLRIFFDSYVHNLYEIESIKIVNKLNYVYPISFFWFFYYVNLYSCNIFQYPNHSQYLRRDIARCSTKSRYNRIHILVYPYLGYQRGCVASGDGFGSRVRTRHGAVSEGSIINFARVVRQRARSKDFYRGSDPIHSIHRAR